MSQLKKLDSDLEAQRPARLTPATKSSQTESEYAVTTWTKVTYLAIYFLCNVSLTIYNKLILGKVSSLRSRLSLIPRSGLILTGACPLCSSHIHGF